MSCNFYVHQDTSGGAKYISGTTCSGTEAYYYLTFGQSVCMDNNKPLVNLNGLVISGSCLPITPTPSTTPLEYCFVSGLTYTTTPYQCPNDGLLYDDIYGSLRITSTIFGSIDDNNPPISVYISNGVQTQTLTIPQGQTFTEFVYPKVNFRYTDTGCISTTYPDWYVIGSPSITQCSFFTPTPTTTPTQTQTQTPTHTQTPSETPTQTPTHTQTSTPTSTQTQTPTNTPTHTQTQTPTNTRTQTPTQTQTPTNTRTQTPTPSITPNAVCPEQLVVSNSTDLISINNGNYNRVYSVSGSSIQYGYFVVFGSSGYVVLGTAPDGNNYPIFQQLGGGGPVSCYVIARGFNTSGGSDLGWFSHGSFDNILNTGGVWGANYTQYLTFNYITISSIRFIQSGQNNISYISYPLVCPTPTPTNTQTQTATPTNTQTQTPTISSTSNPVCAEQVNINIISGSTNMLYGTYDRIRTYSGGTFEYAYFSGLSTSQLYFGTTSGGQNYPVYELQSGSTYSTLIRNLSGTTGIDSWWVYTTTGTSILQNYTIQKQGTHQIETASNTISGVSYPQQGRTPTTINNNIFYVSYPSSCPTPTPTQTTTQTKTPTQTQTPTNTITQTPTNTRTQTPSNTPTQTPTPTRPAPTYYYYEMHQFATSACLSFSTTNVRSTSLLSTGISAFYCNTSTGVKYRLNSTIAPGSYTILNTSAWLGPYTSCSSMPCP